MRLRGFTEGLMILRVGRFGVHASSSLRGSPTSSPSGTRAWMSSCSRIISAARGTSGAACYSLQASARARTAETRASPGLPARWRAASVRRRGAAAPAPRGSCCASAATAGHDLEGPA